MEDLLSLLAFLFFFFVLPLLQKRKAQQRQQEQEPVVFHEPPPRADPRTPAERSRAEPAGRPRVDKQPPAPTPFQEALRQIRESLEEAQREQDGLPPASPSPASSPPDRPAPARMPTRVPTSKVPTSKVPTSSVPKSTVPKPTALSTKRSLQPTGFQRESAFQRNAPAHERHGFGRENPLSEESFERRAAFGAQPAKKKRAAYDPHGLRPIAAPAPPTVAMTPETLLARLRRADSAREAAVLVEILGPPKSRQPRR